VTGAWFAWVQTGGAVAAMAAIGAAAQVMDWRARQPHRVRSREQQWETARRKARDAVVRVLLWRLPGGKGR
jgi:hypothetical protein